MKMFLCAGTHWDREWYQPFQEFRRWLVDLIDGLMDLLEARPEFACFHLDGQTVVIEDYLAIRPERRERLAGLIRDGRIVVGPWYNLPDEWLVSGESLVRNIMRGMRVCRELGVSPMRFLYTPDQFGHIAALPMLSAGFDLVAGICWRGTMDHTCPPQFVWVGPDGSRQPTFKLADHSGYADFLNNVRTPAKLAEGGLTEENVKKVFDPYIERIRKHSVAPLYLMLDAVDHDFADPTEIELLGVLEKLYPDLEFGWGSLQTFGEELAKLAAQLPERRGEMRDPQYDETSLVQYLIVHTLSSRYPLKNRNAKCQALLEKWAEPYSLFQRMAGVDPVPGYLAAAWEYLLKNHPHDSICGCSIDQVHRDMMYRFDQCRLIGEGIVARAFSKAYGAQTAPESHYNFVVHNPLPYARRGVVDIEVAFRDDWPKKLRDGLCTNESRPKFYLEKKDGTRIPYQVSRIDRAAVVNEPNDLNRITSHFGQDVYHLAVELDLPACGYTGFKVVPTPDATRNFGSQLVAPMAASNGPLTFALHSNGTGTLIHEETGREFTDLFIYEDCSDTGDGWTRGIMMNDIVFRTPGTRVTTGIEEDGPLRTVFRVEREFSLPADADCRAYTRSERRETMRVVDRITLDKGASCLRVNTTVYNTCKDHRFRVLFPAEVSSDKSFADSPFAIVERDVPIPAGSATWQERINPEKPLTSFCGIEDEQGGLALIAPFGPHEYEVFQTPERTLALTLFRSTRATVNTAGEPDGQLQEPLEFEYYLFPFEAPFDAQEALQLVAEKQAGVRWHRAAELPGDCTQLELKKNVAIMTALKPADNGDGGIIRLWNVWDKPVEEVIMPSVKVKEACLCNLNEETRQPLTVEKNGAIVVQIPAKGLATVRFTW